VTGPATVLLRAVRAGNGTGREYTITVTCTDASHLSANQTVRVSVPLNQP
jgi:ABC-type transporter Mla subunit MlaD